MAVASARLTDRPTVGELLRGWRQRRKLSQLELALDAGVSSRHVSFLETGRARPSREMVLHLADYLAVPLRERNDLLLAAGFAPLFPERPLESEVMAPVRAALDRFLRAHEPYPALVHDRHRNLVAANDALDVLLVGVAPELLEPPANTYRIALHPDGMAPRIVDFAAKSAYLLAGLRREAAVSGDPVLAELCEELAGYPGVSTEGPRNADAGQEILLPLRLRDDAGGELSFFTTISTFGTPLDITLSELSIEAFYPADAATANRLLASVGAAPSA
jgi:transcriptional regulator with XRE-family HTH domain